MANKFVKTESDPEEEMDIALEGVTENPTDDADIDGDSGEYMILEEF